MNKIILVILLLFTTSLKVYANDLKYPAIVIERVGNQMVIFQQCSSETSCKIIGKPYGYEIDELQFSPNFRKIRAIGTGAIEGVLAIIAAGITWISAGISLPISEVMISALGLSGIAISAKYVDAMNPILQYKMANVEKEIQGSIFDDNDFIAITFQNREKMANFETILKNILKRESSY